MTIKISELPLTNTIAGGDFFVVVRDPAGIPVTSKLYASKLAEGLVSVSFANVAANVIPSVDSIYNLGNIDFQWNSLYVSNQLVVNSYPITVSDGVLTINGTSQALTVRSTAGNNGAVNVAVSTVRTINFDDSTGLHITDQGNGAVFVELGSGFKYINVANQDSIVAVGEDSLTIANGAGIEITTSNTAPKTLTISSTGTVAGGDREIQFNNNGSLGANQQLRFNQNTENNWSTLDLGKNTTVWNNSSTLGIGGSGQDFDIFAWNANTGEGESYNMDLYGYQGNTYLNFSKSLTIQAGPGYNNLVSFDANGRIKFENYAYIQANGTHGIPGQVLTSSGSNGIYWSDATGGGGAGGNAYNIINTNTALVEIGDKGDNWISIFAQQTNFDNPIETTVIDNDGNVIIGGVGYSGNAAFLDPNQIYGAGTGYISKVDASGGIVWTKAILSPFFTDANTDYTEVVVEGLKVDGNNDIYAVVADWSNVPDDNYSTWPPYSYIVKLDTNGNVVWTNYIQEIAGANGTNSYWTGSFTDLVIANNKLFCIGDSNNHAIVVSFDTSNGDIVWTYSSDSINAAYSGAAHQDKLIVGGGGGYVIGLDQSNGALQFVTDLSGGFYNQDIWAVESDGTDWYAMGKGGAVVKISGSDNLTPIWNWNYPNGSYNYLTDIVYNLGHLYVNYYSYGSITLIKADASNGNIMWTNKLTNEFSSMYQWYWYGTRTLDVRNNAITFGGYSQYYNGLLSENSDYGILVKVSTDGLNSGNNLIGGTFTYNQINQTVYTGDMVTTSSIEETYTQPTYTNNKTKLSNSYIVSDNTFLNRTEFLSNTFYTWSFSNTGLIEYPDHTATYSGKYLKDVNETSLISGQASPNQWMVWYGIPNSNYDTIVTNVFKTNYGPITVGWFNDSQSGTDSAFVTRRDDVGSIVWNKKLTKPGLDHNSDGLYNWGADYDYYNNKVYLINDDYGLYASGKNSFSLTKIDAYTGAVDWSVSLVLDRYYKSVNFRCIKVTSQSGLQRVFIAFDELLMCIDGSDGSVLWYKDVYSSYNDQSLYLYSIAVDDQSNNVVAFGTISGTLCFIKFDFTGSVVASSIGFGLQYNGFPVGVVKARYGGWWLPGGERYHFVGLCRDGSIVAVNQNMQIVYAKTLPLSFPSQNINTVYYSAIKYANNWGSLIILGSYGNKKVIVSGDIYQIFETNTYKADVNILNGQNNTSYIWYDSYGMGIDGGPYGLIIGGYGYSAYNSEYDTWNKGWVIQFNPNDALGNNIPIEGLSGEKRVRLTQYSTISNTAIITGSHYPTTGNTYSSNSQSSYVSNILTWVSTDDSLQTQHLTNFGGPFSLTFAANGGLLFPDGTVQFSAASGTGSLSTLTDVAGASNNQVLIYNAGTWSGVNYKTSALLDVNASSFASNASANNFYLKWNNALQKWQANAAVSTMVTLTDVNITANSSIDGYMVVWDNASSKFIARNPFNRAYDISGFIAQTYSANETVVAFVAARNFTFAGNMSGSYARAATGSTSTVTFSLRKNNSQFGTMVFTSANTATFTTNSGTAVNVSAGDMITVVAPGSVDTNILDIAFSLNGTLV